MKSKLSFLPIAQFACLCAALVLSACEQGNAAENRNEPVLAERYPVEMLRNALIPRDAWHPYPKASERGQWSAVPDLSRQAHIRQAEKYLGWNWPGLPATFFLEFARMGNRSNFEAVHFGRRAALADLVLGECLEGDGRFLDDIVNGVWAICEESYWGVPAHIGMQKAGPGLPDAADPTVDLFAGETASLLAWTSYLLGARLDSVSPLVRERIRLEIDRRLLAPNLNREDFHWMGFDGTRVNNWNPWCNSNWLVCNLLLENDPERRARAVHKSLTSIDFFLGPYPMDGGCDEGPGYWTRAGASLFDCLEILYGATGGKIDVYSEPLIRLIGGYLYKVHISGDYFVNFADAPAKVSPDGNLVYRYGVRIQDPDMMGLGAYFGQRAYESDPETSSSIGRRLSALFGIEPLLKAKAYQPYLRDSWFPQLEVMTARDQAGSASGFYLAAKGGHNAESHNHNDVGNFVLYMDGRPVLIDVGVETYSRKTFSPQRYEIWTMQSAYHNLPTLSGVMQKEGGEFRARDIEYRADDSSAEFRLDIAGAYPAEAHAGKWMRTFRLERGRSVSIIDAFELSENSSGVTLSLMTPCRTSVEKPGRIKLEEVLNVEGPSGFTLYIKYDEAKLECVPEDITVEDERLQSFWKDRLTRILLKAKAVNLKERFVVEIAKE